MSHVFISYKREDQDFTLTLKDQLQSAGIDVWMDTERLQAGEDWRQSIDEAIIKDAFALVVIMTPEAKASEYVTYEWSCAHGAGVPIIPIMLKTTPLHPRLAVLQFMDFRQTQRWESLISRLRQLEQARDIGHISIPRSAPAAVQQAVMALDNHDPVVRQSAINSLEQMQHATARQALAGALLHPTRDVQIGAADALIRLRDVQTVDGMVYALRRIDRDLRAKIARVLADIGTPCVDPLTALLSDPDQELRLLAVQVFSRLDAFAIVPVIEKLIYALNDPYDKVRRFAASALRHIIDQKVVIALIKTLRDSNVQVRDAAITSLIEIGDPAVDKLMQVLERDDWRDTHPHILTMLGMIGNPKAVPILLNLFNKQEAKQQIAFLESLAELVDRAVKSSRWQRNSDLEAKIAPLLHSSDLQLRRIAARVLRSGRWKAAKTTDAVMYALIWHDEKTCIEAGTEALPILIAALNDSALQVRITAVRALGRLGDQQALEQMIVLLADTQTDNKTQEEVLNALQQIGAAAMPPLLRHLNTIGTKDDPWGRINREVTRFIDDCASDKHLGLLLNTLTHLSPDHWSERPLQETIRRLAEMADRSEVVTLFSVALVDTPINVRRFAMEMLGKLNATTAVPALLTALCDPDYQINSAAAWALAEMRFLNPKQKAQFEAELVLLLGKGEREVRASVIWLLGERGIQDAVPALISQLEEQEATLVEGMRMCDLASRALVRIGSPEALGAVTRWRQANASVNPA